jgi:hypothetical protein
MPGPTGVWVQRIVSRRKFSLICVSQLKRRDEPLLPSKFNSTGPIIYHRTPIVTGFESLRARDDNGSFMGVYYVEVSTKIGQSRDIIIWRVVTMVIIYLCDESAYD